MFIFISSQRKSSVFWIFESLQNFIKFQKSSPPDRFLAGTGWNLWCSELCVICAIIIENVLVSLHSPIVISGTPPNLIRIINAVVQANDRVGVRGLHGNLAAGGRSMALQDALDFFPISPCPRPTGHWRFHLLVPYDLLCSLNTIKFRFIPHHISLLLLLTCKIRQILVNIWKFFFITPPITII